MAYNELKNLTVMNGSIAWNGRKLVTRKTSGRDYNYGFRLDNQAVNCIIPLSPPPPDHALTTREALGRTVRQRKGGGMHSS